MGVNGVLDHSCGKRVKGSANLINNTSQMIDIVKQF